MKPELPRGSVAAWTEAGDDLIRDDSALAERYTAGGELGRGGMGVVLAATDAWLDREVAVKRPHTDLSEALRSRLMREARITSRLVHPGIVPIYDVGTDDEGPFYTMPVLVGANLTEKIATSNRDVAYWVRTVAAACRAVAYAHTRGVVHRDLKPENILLGEFGEVWVLDWGVALDPASPDNAVVGTPGFQSPEQRRGARVSPSADVWSFGRILEQVLAHQPQHPELVAVVHRCTQPVPTHRYPDAGALADDLQRWLDGRRVIAHKYPISEVFRRWARRRAAPLGVGFVAMIVVTLVVSVSSQLQRRERDRAVAAEQSSDQARQRADEHLSASLAQQAQIGTGHPGRTVCMT